MKIKLSKSQWEGIGKKAGWMKTASSHTNEAFYVLLAGMPREEVVRKYQLSKYDLAEIENMAQAAAKMGIDELKTKVRKNQLPTAFQSLWEEYHKKEKII